MKQFRILGLAVFALLVITLVAGCGGSPDLSGAVPAQPDSASLATGMTPIAKDFAIEYKDVPEPTDVLDNEGSKGGLPTTTVHVPMFWQAGKMNPQAPIVGRRFVGPTGSYGFTSIDRIVVGTTAKGGVTYKYRVTDNTGKTVRMQSPNVWGLNMPGWYIVRASAPGVQSYVFYLKVMQKGAGNVVMDAVGINPSTGREYKPNAKGECPMLGSDRAFVIPVWYNYLTGKRVSPPNMALVGSAWISQVNTVLFSNGSQDYTATGVAGTATVGLNIYPTGSGGLGSQGKGGGGSSYYWYSAIVFRVGKG